MRTIFITCFTGLIGRNILSTGAFRMLAERPDIRLVVLAPESRAKILRQEYAAPNIIVETVATPALGGRDKLIWVLATNLLPSGTRRVQRRAKLARDRNYLDFIASEVVGFLGRFRFVRRCFRWFADASGSYGEYDPLFERYRPDLLFATDVYAPYDVKLMRLARARGVKTVGMVRSWDNVTSKTLLMAIPDQLVVNTERIGQEVEHYGDVPPHIITAVGIPHYDRYRDERLRTPRREFFAKVRLRDSRKLILFTPPSDRYLKSDPVPPVVLAALRDVPANVLVRMPIVGRADLGDYVPPPNALFDAPSNSPDFQEVHLSRAADQHLADSIFHSDLVITWASTMIIDAALFDKPVILVGFDVTPRSYGESILQYYDYDHQRAILATGGARLVRSSAELKEWVMRYLADPSLDAAGRERLRREFCGPLDGKSGERLGKYLLGSLKSNSKEQNAK